MAGNGVSPTVQQTRDFLENMGAGGGGTLIKQADETLHPGTKDTTLSLILKSRVPRELQRVTSWSLAEAMADNALTFDEIDVKGASYLTQLSLANLMVSYPLNGQSREEMVKVLGAVGSPKGRFNRGRGQGGGYDDGEGFQ